MAAPKRPNTAAATAAVVRRGHETIAKKLRAAGWTVTEHQLARGINLLTARDEMALDCTRCDREIWHHDQAHEPLQVLLDVAAEHQKTCPSS